MSPVSKHWQGLIVPQPLPQLLWRDPESGLWNKTPAPLLTMGQGYTCVFPENEACFPQVPLRYIKLFN